MTNENSWAPEPKQPEEQNQSGYASFDTSASQSSQPQQPAPYGAPAQPLPYGATPPPPPNYGPPAVKAEFNPYTGEGAPSIPAAAPVYSQPSPYGAPQQPYAQNGYGYAPQAQGTNILAILSLVAAFVFAPAGIVLGALGLKKIKETGEPGELLAKWGLGLSIAFTAFQVLYFIFIFVAIFSAPYSYSSY